MRESALSESFHSTNYHEAIKYALESMYEIDPAYSYKFYSAFKKTQDLITQQLLKLGLEVDVRYQGPHNAETHIELYGGLELLVILKNYSKKPSEAVDELARCISQILTNANAYNIVDYSDLHRIYIQTRKPTASVTIIPAIWINSAHYKESGLEINRGICEYNFSKKTRRIYLPFLNTARLNSRNRKLGGSLKSMIRLMMSVISDADENIEISYEEVIGILYNMSAKQLAVPKSKYLSLLPNVSQHLDKVISNREFREKLLSPSRHEYVFGKKEKLVPLQQLKKQWDHIAEDISEILESESKKLDIPVKY